jgi:integrase/recombinase XerD
MKNPSLAGYLQSYVALQEALGYCMRARARSLKSFVEYIEARGITGAVPAQTAVDWACAATDRCGASGRASRLLVARGFLTYLSALVPGTGVPSAGLLPRSRRRKPFLFTAIEVASLLEGASRLGPEKSLWPHTVTTLLGLLASAGLRIGEALRLKMPEVFLYADPPHLVIRETKFRKSRLVPLHETTAEKLRLYAHHCRRLGYRSLSDSFFVSEQGGPVHYMAMRRVFLKLLQGLDINACEESRKPSLHSFRHSFAVERLLQSQQQRLDLQLCLQQLSVYLGHVSPKNTYWYLTATPALLSGAAANFLEFVGEEN